MFDLKNHLPVDSINGSKSSFRQSGGSYVENLLGVQLGSPVCFTASTAPLRHSIFDIILRRSGEQVAWLYTCTGIAVMKYAKSFWTLAVYDFPRYSMGFFATSFMVDATISIMKFWPGPNPAPRRREKIASLLQPYLNRLFGMSFHDTSTTVVDSVRVRSVVANRRSRALVPAIEV